jgi:hypothetical protein
MPEIRRRRWSADEDAKIRELYPKHGMSWGGWAAELPGRSAQAIQRRASDIGISKKAWWSTSEDSKIVELFPAHGRDWDGWAVELPARKPRAIADRARHLGVKGPDRKAKEPKSKPKKAKEPASAQAVPSSPDQVRTPPSNTTTKPHRPSRPWTDEQRARLVKLAQSAVDETRHSLGECAVELARIIQEARASRKGKQS